MNETIAVLRAHLAENFGYYFAMLYIIGGRPAAIFSALAVGANVVLLVTAVVALDTLQIPLFYFLYGSMSKRPVVQRWRARIHRRVGRLVESGTWRRVSQIGTPGVVIIAMAPIKGCGMWSGVLLAKMLGLNPRSSYALLITGSLLGCVLLVAFGEAALTFITG